jgi:hypothetical protein
MSLSGNLEDVSVADALQFIHLGGRTGTLTLTRGEETAEIGFYQGRIVSAWAPGSKRLGELLVDSGAISRETLEDALRQQAVEKPRLPLGQILVANGALPADAMYSALQQQIERIIFEIVSWTTGTFDFALDDLKPVDDVSVFPSDLVGNLRVDTQAVLVDALRMFDERNRVQGGPGTTSFVAPAAPLPTPAGGAQEADLASSESEPKLRLQIVSPDRQLVERLSQTIASEAVVARATLRDAGAPPEGEAPPVVLIDLRDPSLGAHSIDQLRRARPSALIVAVAEDALSTSAAYSAGAIACVPGDPPVIASCFRSLVQARKDLLNGGASRSDRVHANLGKLRRIFGDLRSGLVSTTISLSLMNIISESVERAVMFLVRPDALSAVGAFGAHPNGQPLAHLTRGLRLPIAGANALTRVLEDSTVRSLSFDETGVPEAFTRLVGKPRSGQCAVFPVVGGERVIAVVYADNGPSDRAIEELDILELAAAQAGLALENELLRRQSPHH